jgi:hypothetical protein
MEMPIMSTPMNMVQEIFYQTRKFRHIYSIDESIFLVNKICDLTAFCAPSARKKLDTYRIDYQLGITVVMSSGNSESVIQENLKKCRFVVLPRTISTANSLDMLIRDNRISPWLVNDMIDMMERYSLPRKHALSLIESNSDKFLNNLKSVYGQEFDKDIIDALTSGKTER